MNPLLRESAAHVFVDSLEAPALSTSDAHHLGRVLRVRATDAITVSDGVGRWAQARLVGDGVELLGEVVSEAGRSAGERRSVVCAIPKGDRPELIVQKLTELGLDDIAFTTTERTVVKWDARKREAQLERLRRVAREAAMQSRRTWLPAVSVVTWSEVIAGEGVALADPSGGPLTATVRAIVVGPEGGFTDDELAACPRRVVVGAHVLRVETAAIAAGVLLMPTGSAADTR